MKKIISSLAIIAAVSAVVIGGTTAFFTDTETSANNVFTAGSVSLDLTGVAHDYYGDDANSPSFEWMGGQGKFALDDLKPLDTGMLDIALENGANEAHICAMITGDPADLADANDQALYNLLNFWVDDSGEQVTPGDWFELGTNVAPGGALNTGVEYCFGDANTDASGLVSCDYGDGNIDYNAAQNGSFAADLMFYAIQTRNNEGFSCDQLTIVGGEPVYTPVPKPKVGTDLTAYVAPVTGDCTATVSGAESIQTAVNGLTSGGTVCVASSYDMSGDNTYITISNNNVTLAAVTQGITLDVPVIINADNVTVTGFKGAVGYAVGGNAAFYINPGSDNFAITYNGVDGGTGAGVMTETGATYTGGLIANNVLNGATQGVYLNPFTGGTIIVEYNDISNNVAGIGGYNGAIVRYNEFTHTTTGSEAIGVDSTFDANPGTVNYNNFLDGTKLEVYGSITSTIDAENNFFNIGGASQVVGAGVDYTPEAGSQYLHN